MTPAQKIIKYIALAFAVCLIVGIIGVVALLITDFEIISWYPACDFFTKTGLYCPGCGVTRMSVALLQLDFERAFYYHPVLLCSLPLLGVCFGL